MVTGKQHVWVNALFVLSLGLGIIDLLFPLREIGQPFGGIATFYNVIVGHWYVDQATPPWWSGIAQAGIQGGDRLVAIDGQPYDGSKPDVYSTAAAQGRDRLTLLLRRGETEIQTQVPIVRFTLGHFLDIETPDLIFGLGLWLLGLSVYRAAPTRTLSRVFAVVCCLGAVSRWLSWPGLFPHGTLPVRALDLIGIVLVNPLVGMALIHLTLLFPTSDQFRHPLALAAIYGSGAATITAYGLSRLGLWTIGRTPWVAQLDNYAVHALVLLTLLGIIVAMARLFWLCLQQWSVRRMRNQAILLLIGFGGAMPYIVAFARDMLLNQDAHRYWYGLDLRYLGLAIPMMAAVAIVRYQALRTAPPLVLVVAVLSSSAILASVTEGLLKWRQASLVVHESIPSFTVLFGALLAASLLWSTQTSWRGFFGRLLEWERVSYAAVQRFGQRLLRERDLAVLPTAIAEALVSELERERAAVWLWREDRACLAGQAGRWLQAPPLEIQVTTGEVEALGDVYWLNNPTRPTPTWLQPLIGDIEWVVPLIFAGEPVGLLGVGTRWDEEISSEREKEIMRLLAQQSVLFLLTASHVASLREVPRRVAEAQERERAKIGRELHDETQQFLGALPFHLDRIRRQIRANPDRADVELREWIRHSANAAQKLMEIRSALTLSHLERALLDPLEALADEFANRTGIPTIFQADPAVDVLSTKETRYALYRVVKQALDNVEEHAQASQVRVMLTSESHRLLFDIVDNGCGFLEAQRGQAMTEDKFGLLSMQAWVESLEGVLLIDSAPNAGTRVHGWVPLA